MYGIIVWSRVGDVALKRSVTLKIFNPRILNTKNGHKMREHRFPFFLSLERGGYSVLLSSFFCLSPFSLLDLSWVFEDT